MASPPTSVSTSETPDPFVNSEAGAWFYISGRFDYENWPPEIPPYPFKAYCETHSSNHKRFERLRAYEFELRSERAPVFNLSRDPAWKALDADETRFFRGHIRVHPSNYDEFDNFDYNEEARIQAYRKNSVSPAEFWLRAWESPPERNLIYPDFENVLNAESRSKRLACTRALRDRLAQLHYECTTFKPSMLVGFVKLLDLPENPRILDMCSGYGERLLASIAVKAGLYVGTDPNVALQKGYIKILRGYDSDSNGHPENFTIMPANITLVDKNKITLREKVVLLAKPFEDCGPELEKIVAEHGKFHLMFSSPPYGDLEIYDPEDKNQSIEKYPTTEKWFTEFLMKGLVMSVKLLRAGGFLVININDPPQTYANGKAVSVERYTTRMVGELGKMRNVKYLGCLPQWTGNPKKSGQPFFIFRKVRTAAK